MTRRLLLPPLVTSLALVVACAWLPVAASADDVVSADPGAAAAQAPVAGAYADLGQSGAHAPVVTGPTGRSIK